MKKSYTELMVEDCEWMSTEEKEIILFGIRQGKNSLYGILVILFIGIIMGVIWESVLFIIYFVPLRRYAGGFHAQTKGRCMIFSVMLIISTFLMIKYLRGIVWFIITLSAICLIFLWRMVPVENQKRQLCKEEKAYFRKKARWIAGIEFMTMLFAVFFGKIQYAKTVMAVLVAAVLCIVLGYAQLKIRHQTN